MLNRHCCWCERGLSALNNESSHSTLARAELSPCRVLVNPPRLIARTPWQPEIKKPKRNASFALTTSSVRCVTFSVVPLMYDIDDWGSGGGEGGATVVGDVL